MTGTSRQIAMLRAGYLGAASAALALGILSVSGAVLDAMPDAAGSPLHGGFVPPGVNPTAFALIGLLFAFLAFHPSFWGKLIAAWAGLSWTGFGATSFAILHAPLVSAVVAAAGVAAIAACALRQIADPRFGGPYMRSFEASSFS